MGTHHKITETLENIGHGLVPAFLIGLVLVFLLGYGSLQLLIDLWN